jgi:hypothetical protein
MPLPSLFQFSIYSQIPKSKQVEFVMKRLALFFVSLVVATPLFAADDLCAVNLQKLKELRQTAVMGQPALGDIQQDRKDAEAAQKAGDKQKCIDLTNRALKKVKDVQGNN